MKKNYFFVALSGLLTVTTFAQPVLNATDLNPTVGESFILYSSSYISPGNSGANVTWDLSSLSSSSSNTVEYLAANPNFPGTNMTLSMNSGASSIYINASPTGITYNGMNSSTLITYQDPMELNFYPVSYNATNTDYFHATFTSGVDWERYGTITGTVDGYGTLITPEGTFTNVMRVHYVQNYVDSSDLMVIDYETNVYGWYKAGIHNELASVSSITTSLGSSNQYSGFLETGGLGLSEEEMNVLVVYPNPVTDFGKMQLIGTEKVESIQLIDLNGRLTTLEHSQNDEEVQFSANDMEKGLYFLKVNYTSGVTKTVKIEVI